MKDDRIYLEHIYGCLQRVLTYTQAGRSLFMSDPKTLDAVTETWRSSDEAAKQLSEEFKKARPDVEWRRIASMRDFLIHVYFGINLEPVWEVVEHHVPVLLDKVTAALHKAS